ncbi:uncharacterized protein PHACADRAFT_213956 [Phanerochaete carnosa HHB-10118-sp]|uniref:Uncharacterized protein n=1 Tax=Phanerochaete carnosa (strain HHB-10118-sp) TaxID=650164 RepID=K5WIY0_PHACS|nr:uncharacterized protein PHACADRAFT_213956 [Phanerochaete carnosa HHB-10118-sp]EKM50207.1 hypothetical protein PHACADRAFT_213956 [Phanerochaete carnosa HHB-10118-sp]
MDGHCVEAQDFLRLVFGTELVDGERCEQALTGELDALKSTLSKVPARKATICRVVVDAVNSMFQKLNLPFFMAITGDNPESATNNLTPDLMLYRTSQPGKADPSAFYYPGRNNSAGRCRAAWAAAVATL